MTPDQYWMMKMTQYIDRFTLFRTMMTQATGITDDEAIQAHWELLQTIMRLQRVFLSMKTIR